MLPPTDATQLAVDLEPQLFVDSLIIDATQGLTRRWHQPARRDTPLIVADRPWEHTLYFTYSNYCVVRDPKDRLIKCWYEDLGPLEPGGSHPVYTRLLYAESEDGITFTKPEFDICPIDGRPTNIVMGYAEGAAPTDANPWADIGVHSNGIVIDAHPSSPDERFRTIFSRSYRNEHGGGVHQIQCAHSPDGIHWQPYDWCPQLGSSGSQLSDVSCLHYDPDARMFVQNTRHIMLGRHGAPSWVKPVSRWCGPYMPHNPTMMNKRRVYQTRSADFRHWTEPIAVSTPDDAVDNLDDFHYGMGQFRVGRHHFATLGVFQYVDSRMHVRLLHSRNGVNFVPTQGNTPFLAPRGEGFWDAHMVSITSPPIEVDGEWRFYHGGTTSHHDWWMDPTANIDEPEARDPQKHVKFALGVATLRKEGFASLDACRQRDGYLITKPLHTRGDTLVINARCRPGGSIKAALLDRDANPAEGFNIDECDTFTGDNTSHRMTWQGRSNFEQTHDWKRVHLLLRDAEVFSIRFETAAN